MRVAWFLVFVCAAVALSLGLAAALDQDCDIRLYLRQPDDPFGSQQEPPRAIPLSAACRTSSARVAQTPERAPGLLAAVPGGLCLLN
jgi:hypothetical protein